MARNNARRISGSIRSIFFRTISDQGGPHQHGSCRGSAAAVPRSPHCGIRRVRCRPALKIQGSRQKVILRNLMRGKLSPAILNRKKIGFDIPTHDWFRGPAAAFARGSRGVRVAEHSDFFRMSKIEADVRAHLDRRANLGYHLWGLMTLFFWMKKWGIQTRRRRGRRAGRWKKFSLLPDRGAGCRRRLCGCMHFASFADGRRGRSAGADRAQHAHVGRLGDGAAGRNPVSGKAPLIYWLIAGSFKIFGATDWAARIPDGSGGHRAGLADRRVWDLGVRTQAPDFTPGCACPLASGCFSSPAF